MISYGTIYENSSLLNKNTAKTNVYNIKITVKLL